MAAHACADRAAGSRGAAWDPVLFARRLFGELRSAPLDAGAKTVVRAYASAIVNVEVDDRGCLVDVDTPDEYRRLVT